MDTFYNFLLGLIFIVIGVFFFLSTYKKPAPFYSTDIKGYLAGFLFILLGILCLIGKFSILEILRGG